MTSRCVAENPKPKQRSSVGWAVVSLRRGGLASQQQQRIGWPRGEKARTARAVVVVALCADGEGIVDSRNWKLLSQCDPKSKFAVSRLCQFPCFALVVGKVNSFEICKYVRRFAPQSRVHRGGAGPRPGGLETLFSHLRALETENAFKLSSVTLPLPPARLWWGSSELAACAR